MSAQPPDDIEASIQFLNKASQALRSPDNPPAGMTPIMKSDLEYFSAAAIAYTNLILSYCFPPGSPEIEKNKIFVRRKLQQLIDDTARNPKQEARR